MTVYYSDDSVTLHLGDALEVARELPSGSADCIVTSPPYYGLRDYGIDGQYGLEGSPAEYVETIRALFSELRRVLADDGTLWLNLGDSFAAAGGHTDPGRSSALQGRRVQLMQGMPTKPADRGPKNLLGIPWRVAFALQDDGWTLRNAIVWHKPNAMPESVTDRLSTSYEPLFLLSKSRRYWFDLDSIREPLTYPDARDGRVFGGKNKGIAGGVGATARRRGNTYAPPGPGRHPETDYRTDRDHAAENPKGRNPGDVWSITTQPFAEAHFAVMPVALAERCVQAGCRPSGVVLDPFSGSGTTGLAAAKHGRRYVGIDLNAEYLELSLRTRLQQSAMDFKDGA